MKIKEGKEPECDKCVEINSNHPYSRCVIDYMIRWADMMEDRISKGEKISDIAKETSHEADTEGITGFMYGCAVNILAQVWEYGEELRTWHNSQYGYKGEGTVNPAILSVGRIS